MSVLAGVVHLQALPGSPRARLPLREVIALAVADARALEQGGADVVIVENFHDAPFRKERVEAYTIAAMTAACLAVREAVTCRIGINVLRNDAAAALGIASACGARCIRVNVHTGAMLTDQGIVEGRADETLRLRRQLGAEAVEIWADVQVKHAVPLAPQPLEEAVRDAVERGLADAVIVTGSATGQPAGPEDVRRAAVTHAPVLVGSGVTPEQVPLLVPPAAGVIVGTWLKADGRIENPVDPRRVAQLREALDRANG